MSKQHSNTEELAVDLDKREGAGKKRKMPLNLVVAEEIKKAGSYWTKQRCEKRKEVRRISKRWWKEKETRKRQPDRITPRLFSPPSPWFSIYKMHRYRRL